MNDINVDVEDAPVDVVVAVAKFKASSMSVLVYDQPSIVALERIGFGARLLPTNVSYIGGNAELTKPGIDDRALLITNSMAVSEAPIQQIDDDIHPPAVTPLLLLLDEEVMYLCKKDRLAVSRDDGSYMTVDELWRILSSKSVSFICKYKVYEHYKDNSYVVKSVINFGVDYCLYQRSPDVCHSEICITVINALHDNGDIVFDDGGADRIDDGRHYSDSKCSSAMSWRHITTLTRVVPDVMKLCVICYVLPHPSSSSIPTAHLHDDDNDVSLGPSLTDGGVLLTGISIDTEARILQTQTAIEQGVVVDDTNGASHGMEPTRSPYIDQLFSPSHVIDYSTIRCLDSLQVRPVALIVRRTKTNEHNYETISDVQKRLQKTSKPKKPKTTASSVSALKHGHHGTNRHLATDGVADGDAMTTLHDSMPSGVASMYMHLSGRKKKSLKQRRDPQEVRQKGLSKSNKVFRKLMQGTGNAITTMMMKKGQKQQQHQQQSGSSSSSSRGLDRGVGSYLNTQANQGISSKRTRSDSMLEGLVDSRVAGSKGKMMRVDEASNKSSAMVAHDDSISSVDRSIDRAIVIQKETNASIGLLQRCVLM